MAEEADGRVRVSDVKVFQVTAEVGGHRVPIVGLSLLLEDGRVFDMYNIPPEVAIAIVAMQGEGQHPRRMSIFDLLANYSEFKDLLADHLKEVVIDEVNEATGLYTATVVFREDDFETKVKMIPSHAVFLALLVGAPIYVSEELIRRAEEMEEG